MKTKPYFYLAILTLLLSFSCSIEDTKDKLEDEIDETIDGADLTAKVNGVTFESKSKDISSEITVFGDDRYTFVLSADDVNQKLLSGKLLGFSVTQIGFADFRTGAEFTSIASVATLAIGCQTFYAEDNVQPGIALLTDVTESVSIKITAIDKEAKILSGEFSYVTIDTETGKKYNVTEGKFNNIDYLITEY